MRIWRASGVLAGPVALASTIVLAGTVVLLAAGCSAGSSTHSAAAGGAGTPASAPGSVPASAASATATAPLAVPTPSAPSTSGQLRVLLHEDFPVQSSDSVGVIAAEAPDGSVFATFGSQQSGFPATTPGTAVYVVDGDQQVQVAEHPQIPVTALAADETYLYAGGGTQIIEYSRATGAVVRTWTLAMPVRLMTVAAGRLWAVLGSTSGPGQIAEVNPDASTMTTVGTDAEDVLDVAAGPLGLYYVPAGGTTIVHVSATGQRQEAPTHLTVNAQLSGAGAVQAISVIGGQLLLVANAGQGLDSVSRTYDAATLAGPQTQAPGTAGSNHAIDSLAGPVDLSQGGSLACSAACVGRYNLSSGAVTDAVRYPSGVRLGILLGPYPAVVVFPPSGSVYLDRIG